MSRWGNKSRLPGFITDFICDNAHLTREEEQRLASIIHSPDSTEEEIVECRNALVSANYKFAISTIKNYSLSNVNLDYDDIFQSAAEGLMKAAEKFKPGRGKFCTYAKMWILSKVRSSIEDNIYCVKTSSSTKQKIEMVISIANEMSHIEGKQVHPQEVAILCNFDLNEIEVGLKGINYAMIDDDHLPTEDKVILEIAFNAHLESVKEVLTPYEYDIIARKFGLGEGREKSSNDIGREYCVSGQRIRIIIRNIIKKLKEEFDGEQGGIFLWLE